MKYMISYGPSFAWLTLELDAGEHVTAEAGSMVTMSPSLTMETRLNSPRESGLFAKLKLFFIALIRKFLAGETMFINDFSSSSGGQLRLAPGLAGSILHRRLHGERLFLSPGAYLASSSGLTMRLRFGGIRAIVSRGSPFFIEISGTGDLWMNAHGGITEIPVEGSFVVDNGHIVAFDSGLDFKIKSASGELFSSFASGEGLVCELSGQGSVWIQSRGTSALVGWLKSFLPR